MDSLTRCVSGRSKDAIMPVMAVGARTGTHQDESKRSVRGAEDAASRLLWLHKSRVGDSDDAVCHCAAPPPQIPPPTLGDKDGLSFPDYHHFRHQTQMFRGLFCLRREIVSDERLQFLWFPPRFRFSLAVVSGEHGEQQQQLLGHGLLFGQGSCLELEI